MESSLKGARKDDTMNTHYIIAFTVVSAGIAVAIGVAIKRRSMPEGRRRANRTKRRDVRR
jgi:hypothetical protein